MFVDGDEVSGSSVVVVGGCGRVGLPLGVALSTRGFTVTLYDRNPVAVATVSEGRLPFDEPGAAEPLERAVRVGLLSATTDPRSVAFADTVIVVVGTPVDAHLNPDLSAVPRAVEECADHLHDGQLLILRSTVHPGVTTLTEKVALDRGLNLDVAFCPERIAEGKAMTELFDLPQIVAARTERAYSRAEALFARVAPRTIRLTPEEAEFAKLFTNTWRYMKFATANQFWMMANDAGLDFDRIRSVIVDDYPRARDLPGPGFAAGPCLFKDTMQLAAFDRGNFPLGHSAMLINEGLPQYLVSRLELRYDLSRLVVGILGMSFKAGSDDTRSSLSFKLRKILAVRTKETLCTDPYAVDDRFLPLDEVLQRADLLVIGAPHPDYRNLPTTTPIADIWGLTGNGTRI